MFMRFRIRLLRFNRRLTTGSCWDRVWWKLVAMEEQWSINAGRFSAECKWHCVRARWIWPKCIVRVSPTVEMAVGFVPRYYDQIIHNVLLFPYTVHLTQQCNNSTTCNLKHIWNKNTYYSKLSLNSFCFTVNTSQARLEKSPREPLWTAKKDFSRLNVTRYIQLTVSKYWRQNTSNDD